MYIRSDDICVTQFLWYLIYVEHERSNVTNDPSSLSLNIYSSLTSPKKIYLNHLIETGTKVERERGKNGSKIEVSLKLK